MKLLIAETTREERERIVAESLSCGDTCSNCGGCSQSMIDMYKPYIDGRMELSECNRAYRARYVSGNGRKADEDDSSYSCPM
ncbi:MAG: purine biosynthesis protein PurH [Lachnospira sp.]|nr:purine biosynthesis protein PurH [Lachnospira sp.]